MSLAPGTRLGPYEVVAPIGAGGMGEVYRAKDTRLDRQVAIKVLPTEVSRDADRLSRFEREAKAVAALSHPNILALFDFGEHQGQAYAVTELLEGETLRDRLTKGALPARKATEYAIQIARGLAAAHDKGLVHRDLKPENIFLLRDGQVKILDFGLARSAFSGAATGATQTVAAMTDPGTVMGTVGYMAPEQVRGQVVDARSDLFAFGAVLYEMVSGGRAFHRDTAADTMTAVLKEDPPEITGTRAAMSPAIDRIIRHCLEKNPVERFQSARDVAFALEALSGTATAGSGATVAPAVKPRRVQPLAIGAALIVIASVAGVFAGRSLTRTAPASLHFTMKTFEPQTIVNARFMPDGVSIVFSAALTGNAVQLFEIRSGTLEEHPVGPPRTHLLSVSSKGELAVLTDARAMGQRLFAGTLARMSIEGSPRPWMQDVREADWSPDGTTLAIVHNVGTKDRLEYPIGIPLYETAGYISDPRVSPDGARVAFMDHQARFDDRGWVKVVDRSGKVTTLAGEFWGEEGLAWSRDGATVYFAANDRQPNDEAQAGDITYQVRSATLASPGTSVSVLTTPGDFNLYDIAADGRWLATREDIRLGVGARVAGETSDRDLSWLNQNWGASISRDGTRFLFSDGTAGANYSVVWRKTDGSPIVRLGEGNVLGWSPDEKWALAHTFAPVQLIVYPMGAGETVRLKRGVIAEYQTALWFPDGKSVLVVGNATGQPTRAYRQTIPDGEPMPILADGVWPAAIAPDGQTILGVAGDGTWNWYPVDGGVSKPALGVSAQDNPTGVNGWSDDGRSFFIRTGNEIPATLDRVDVATGRRTTIRQIGPPDRAGVFTLGVNTVTHDGAQYAYGYQKRLSTMFVVTGGR